LREGVIVMVHSFGWNCLECLNCEHQFPIPNEDDYMESLPEEVDRCPLCCSDNVEFSNWRKVRKNE